MTSWNTIAFTAPTTTTHAGRAPPTTSSTITSASALSASTRDNGRAGVARDEVAVSDGNPTSASFPSRSILYGRAQNNTSGNTSRKNQPVPGAQLSVILGIALPLTLVAAAGLYSLIAIYRSRKKEHAKEAEYVELAERR